MSAGDGTVGTVIDVSKWQSSLPSLKGVLGVIARAGIGTKPDDMFTGHIAAARKAGLWVGSYWYNIGSLTPAAEVNAYIAREAEVGGVALHTIDWEGADGFTAAQTAEFIRIYKARTGDPIGMYASEGRYRDLGQDFNWIANYSQEPSKSYDMWQYGPFRGVDGNNARQRILDLVKGAVTPMPAFDLLPGAQAGTITVKTDVPHAFMDADGVVHAITDPVGFGRHQAYGPVKLVAPGIPGGAKGEDRQTVYAIGTRVAYMLKNDVNFLPDAGNKAELDAAKAALVAANDLLAKTKAEDQAALEKAAADLAAAAATERERIALALAKTEADRVRNT